MNPSRKGHRLGAAVHLLDEDLLELADLARTVAEERIAPHAAEVDQAAIFPKASLEALIESDLHAVGIPEQYGGAGGTCLASAVVAEEIARVCATSQQVSGANELFAWPLLLGGGAGLKERYLPKIASGDWLGAFALSEPDAGSDIAAMSTRATRVADGWLLRGTKRWITNADAADVYVVFATTEPARASAFVVERHDTGLSFGALEKKMGLRGSPTREIYLDDVLIPDDRIVGDPGAGLSLALGTLDRTRTAVAGQALGIAQGAFDVAAAYVKERQQFGRPIADNQGIQFMLADMEMRVRSARLLTYAAALEAEIAGPDMGPAGATAKCVASDTAMSVTTDAIQLLGGYGYTQDFPLERMFRDAKVTQIYEGTNQIQRIVLARHILTRA